MSADPSHSFRMTLIVSRHSERRQKCCVGNLVNETVRQIEESITLMTSYRFPHHNSRSFTFVQDDVLPFPIIKRSGKNGKRDGKTE